MPYHIDIAVNLLGSALENQIDSVINEAAGLGVSPLIVIGSSLDESAQAIEICQQYPRQLYCTAGVHPHHASLWDNQSPIALRTLCQSPDVKAVGECGLDYNRDFSPRDMQRKAFAAQLALAVDLNMPVLMHCREAHTDFTAILQEFRPHLPAALLHCFTGSHDEMQACLALDLHIGVTGWVCDERRGQELAALVPLIPDHRIMIETDSPYLLPRSMRPKPKSSKNYPKYLPYIAEVVAQLRGQTPAQLAAHCYANSAAFFNIEAANA